MYSEGGGDNMPHRNVGNFQSDSTPSTPPCHTITKNNFLLL